MIMRRILTAALALLMAAAAFASCGDTATTPVDTNGDTAPQTETADETEAVLRADLPDKDWGGRTFMVLGREHPTYTQFNNFEVWTEKEVGEVVNDAVFRRNSIIEEKYNVEIAQVLDEFPEKLLQQSASAGDHLYDLAFIGLSNIGPCIQNGYFYDLYDVEHIDFSKPWWNPEVNEAVSMCGKLYATTSDFSLLDKSRAYIMMYNIDLAERLEIPDLVQTVRDGKWTVDVMLSYVKDLGGDLDGDGKMGGEFDSFGLVMDSYNSFMTFVYGMDVQSVTKDKDDKPVITMNNDRMVNAVERVVELTCDPSYALFCDDFKDKTAEDYWGTSGRAFYSERALFSTCFPHVLKSASEKAEFDYGVLPMPKYDEAQEKHYTYADIFCMMMGIPVTSAEPEFSGFMLEALSAASTNTTLTAYYDVSCKTKYSYNPETGEMLDLIFDGIYYDPAMIYSIGKLRELLSVDLPKKKSNIFVSQYTKYEKGAQRALDKLVEAIENLEH